MGSPTLTDLSNETLLLIFGNFCLHCRGEFRQQEGIGTVQQHQHQHRRQQQRQEQAKDEKSWYSVDRHALFSLCLVSKRFQGLAMDVLYHEFTLGYGDSWNSDLYTWDGRLASFLQTVGRRRDLARLVKRVSINPSLGRCVSIREAGLLLVRCATALGVKLPEAYNRRILEALGLGEGNRHQGFPPSVGFMLNTGSRARRSERMLQALEKAQDQSMLASELFYVLVALLPNVEYLTLPIMEWTDRSSVITTMQLLHASTLPVKTLDIYTNAHFLLSMATGLETLNLGTRAHELRIIPPLPRLKFLRVTEIVMSSAELKSLLSACTGGLHTFVYEADHKLRGRRYLPLSPDADDHQFSTLDAVDHLYKHRDTLVTLHLDFRQQLWVTRNVHAESFQHMFNLNNFPTLKHVCLSANAIYGFRAYEVPDVDGQTCDEHVKSSSDYESLIERIPLTIVSLHITHGTHRPMSSRLEQGLLGLAATKQKDPEQFPNLGEIKYDSGVALDDALGNVFSAVNVDFGYESLPLSKYQDYFEDHTTLPGLERREIWGSSDSW